MGKLTCSILPLGDELLSVENKENLFSAQDVIGHMEIFNNEVTLAEAFSSPHRWIRAARRVLLGPLLLQHLARAGVRPFGSLEMHNWG